MKKCTHINVNSVHNDQFSIKKGAPYYLGFDFFVEEEKTNESIEFIKIVLESFDIPIINIGTFSTLFLDEKQIWSKDKIYSEIERNAEYLKCKARSYNIYPKTLK